MQWAGGGGRRRRGASSTVCVVAVIPTGDGRSRGTSVFESRTAALLAAWQWNSLCQARKRSATHSSWRVQTASQCCTRSLGDGQKHSASLVSARAPHAHRAMGLQQVKPEGGEGERDGVQEGGNSCPQGRPLRLPAPAGVLEQKKSTPMAHGPWTRPGPGHDTTATPQPGPRPARSRNCPGPAASRTRCL
jgi:hypothetical protein